MSKSVPFIQSHKLEAELGNYPPFIIREATRNVDKRRVIVKIYCKLGQTNAEQEKVQTEIQFWRLVTHPRVVELSDVFDEEGFIYIVYEFPAGGDLAALVMDSSRTFTEGFARKVTAGMLDALIWLHSNGIVHGGVLPANIIFSSATDVPGWADTSKLTFFRVDNTRSATVFSDIQDLAYSIVSIMRKRAGLLSRTYFTPDVLQNSEWSHLTNDFMDFVEQLWFCKDHYKTAETFLDHPWLKGSGASSTEVVPRSVLSHKAVSAADEEQLSGYCYVKMREKKNGKRRWRRRWGVVVGGVLLLYASSDEDRITNQDLAEAVRLRNKTAVVLAMSRHDFTFGLQDTSLQQIVFWMRFDTEDDYGRWKSCIIGLHQREVNLASGIEPNAAGNVLSPHDISFVKPMSDALAPLGDGKDDSNFAENLVRAVDTAAKEYTRQIEAQAAAYVRKSQMLQQLRGNKLGNVHTSRAFNHSFSPFPSEQKTRVHPAVKWDMRAQELMLVMSTGTPVNVPVAPGHQWFIIDAVWFKHWVSFVSSSRRLVPPGPIDNLWMINPMTDAPYEHMVEDTDDVAGDFRRIPPQIWELFEVWYGGGPAISVVGPPIEDTRRWTVHVYESTSEEREGESLVELVAKLEHPEDIVQRESKNGKESRVAVKLQGRRPTVAELTFLSKTADFNDGEGDKAETGLSAVDSDEEAEENDDDDDDDFGSGCGSVSGGSFAPLTAAHLNLISGDEDDDVEEPDPPRPVTSTGPEAKPNPKPEFDTQVKEQPAKRSSIFRRSRT